MNKKDRYSLLIYHAKVTLPVLALVLLCFVFTTSPKVKIYDDAVEEKVQSHEQLHVIRVSGAQYTGAFLGNALAILEAEEAGLEYGGAEAISLKGQVDLTLSNGWKVQSSAVHTNIAMSELYTEEAVRVTGPAGAITADSMKATRKRPESEAYLLNFDGSVKLTYQPTG